METTETSKSQKRVSLTNTNTNSEWQRVSRFLKPQVSKKSTWSFQKVRYLRKPLQYGQTFICAVIGKPQSQLGFKSRFEHIWWFDMRYATGLMIPFNEILQFDLRFSWNFAILFEQLLNHAK